MATIDPRISRPTRAVIEASRTAQLRNRQELAAREQMQGRAPAIPTTKQPKETTCHQSKT